jgi:integrase
MQSRFCYHRASSKFLLSLSSADDNVPPGGYLAKDPLEGFAGFDITPQTERRAMTAEEIHGLLDVCAPHRRLLYEVAFTTGLRANELRQLTADNLDTTRCGLRLDAVWTKARKAGFQPLPDTVVTRLAEVSLSS